MLRMPCLSRWIMMATMPRCSGCQAHPEPSAAALSGESLGSALLLGLCYVCLIHQILGEIQGELVSTCSHLNKKLHLHLIFMTGCLMFYF